MAAHINDDERLGAGMNLTDEEIDNIIADIAMVRATRPNISEDVALGVVLVDRILNSPLRQMTKDMNDVITGGINYMSTQLEVKREARRAKEQEARKKRLSRK
jgi:hypothetical protein